MRYYNVFFGGPDTLGVGRSRSDDLLFLPRSGLVDTWSEPVVDLVNGDFPDYLAVNVGGQFCSRKMRDVLDAAATEADVLQWLPARVFRGAEVRDYWVLHFPSPVPAFGKRTLWHGDVLVKPVLSLAKLQGHAVLAYPAWGTVLIINARTKTALKRAGCTGYECSPALLEP